MTPKEVLHEIERLCKEAEAQPHFSYRHMEPHVEVGEIRDVLKKVEYDPIDVTGGYL